MMESPNMARTAVAIIAAALLATGAGPGLAQPDATAPGGSLAPNPALTQDLEQLLRGSRDGPDPCQPAGRAALVDTLRQAFAGRHLAPRSVLDALTEARAGLSPLDPKRDCRRQAIDEVAGPIAASLDLDRPTPAAGRP